MSNNEVSFRKKTDNVIEIWTTYHEYVDMYSDSFEVVPTEPGEVLLGKIAPIPKEDSKFTVIILEPFALSTRVMNIITEHMKLLEEAASA